MVAEQDIGTPYSGFGVIPDEIVNILGSVMAEKYFKALESGSRRGITDDEWTVLTGLRANYGTYNFANPTFVGMLEPLSTMGVEEIAQELNTRQKNIPPFGTPEYSEYRRENPLPASPLAKSLDNRENPTDTDLFRSFLLPSELRQLKQVLSPVAYTYLTTGKYQTISRFGEPEEFLSAGQRNLLQKYAKDPSSVRGNQLIQFAADRTEPDVLAGVVDRIIVNRREEDVASVDETTEIDRKKEPNVPLPPGQIYSYDSTTNLWKVIGSPGSGKAQQFIRYVNQMGETVDERGNRIDTVAPGFGPERGTEQPPAPSPAPTQTGGQIGSAAAAFAQAEFGAGLPTEVDEAALASAEFGVGGPASGRGFTETVQGGFSPQPVSTGMGGGGGVSAPVVETPPVPIDWETAAQEMYPEYYAIVKDNPEIAELLKKAMGPPEWSEQKFTAELRGTNWWKTTTAAAREWDLGSGLDPASYQTKVDEAATAIQTEALNLGIRLSDETVQKLALESQRFGWGTQTITNAIGMAAVEGGTEGATQLREGFYGQQVRSLASQYGVTLADTTFNSFVNKLAVGEETLGSFQDYAMTIGKSLYPPLADQFDAGRTFEDVTSSYKNIAANILERDSNAIDMSSPEFVQAITYVPDTKTGEQRLMNMGEWGDYLRKTESLGYQNTTEARSRAYEVSNKIANMFGRV